MKSLDWFQARALLKQGKAVRRDDWRRWITRGLVLCFTDKLDDEGNALHYVVKAGEFGSAEFLARDWTDEPWPDGGTPPTGTPPALPPPHGPTDPGAPGGGGTPGSPGTPGGLPGLGNWGDWLNHPDPISIYQPSGGSPGGGSPGTGGEHPPTTPPHTPPAGQGATVSVSFFAPPSSSFEDFSNGGNCFVGGDEGVRTISRLIVEVDIAGGPGGVGTLSLTLQGQTQIGTGWAGMNQAFEFPGISYLPGSTVTATATYVINGDTYAGSGNYSFPTWCDGHCIPSSQNLTVVLSGIHVNGSDAGENYSGSPDGTYSVPWAGSYWETTFNAGSYSTDEGETTTPVGWTLRVNCAGGNYIVGLGTDFPLLVGGFSVGLGTGEPLNSPSPNTFAGDPYAFIGGSATVRAVL